MEDQLSDRETGSEILLSRPGGDSTRHFVLRIANDLVEGGNACLESYRE
jgi:hypothetical protein